MSKITLKTQLNAPAVAVMDMLSLTETLALVAEGLVTYDTFGTWPKRWRKGQRFNLKPRLLGIPLGDHFVRVTEVDEKNRVIKTEEEGKTAKVWKHTMRVVELYPEVSLLIDELEVEARHWWQTPGLIVFILLFYSHRHRRWRKLIGGK